MATKSQASNRNMRIHGLPYQFTAQVDPRFKDVSETVGRKYFQNILMQAPIVTIIPGEPSYLPGVDDPTSVSNYLLKNASSDFSLVRANFSTIANKKDGSEIRYYDFMPTYTKYMSYVNILCRAMATFLEIEEKDADTGDVFTQYDWQNWTNSGAFTSSSANFIKSLSSSVYTSTKKITSKVYETVTGKQVEVKKNNSSTSKNTNTSTTAVAGTIPTTPTKKTDSSLYRTDSKTGNVYNEKGWLIDEDTGERKVVEKVTYVEQKVDIGERDMIYQTYNNVTQTKDKKTGELTATEDDTSFLETLDMILANKNYVQFYMDADSTGYTENFGNETATSQLKSMFESGQALFKELAFVMNSGGSQELNEALGDFIDSAADSLSTNLFSNGITSTIGRLLGLGGNIIKGENVIMPDIYQASSRQCSYSCTLKLKNIYGTKYGFYKTIAVPMAFALALVLPRQTTANTYASPFLVKAFMDGMFTCNLGMITDFSINKNVNPESWTNDGLPNEVDIQFTIVDLYSDLSMSPQENPLLFVNNTSLIEFLATTCGLSLVTPKLATKANLMWTAISSGVTSYPKTIMSNIMEDMDNIIYKIVGF